MTVNDLIQLLSDHPPDLRVVVDGYEEGYDDLSPGQLRLVKISLNTGRHEYVGTHGDVDYLPKRDWLVSKSKRRWHCAARLTDRGHAENLALKDDAVLQKSAKQTSGVEWREVSLGDIAEICHGFAFKRRCTFTDQPRGDRFANPRSSRNWWRVQMGKLRYYERH